MKFINNILNFKIIFQNYIIFKYKFKTYYYG